MIERRERKPYWRSTKWSMVVTIVPYLVLAFALPLYAQKLNANKFLGFPLGYFLAGHGLLMLAVVAVATFVNRQDAIDHWHGANEDT